MKLALLMGLSLLMVSQVNGQKLVDRAGTAHFFSEAPLENIEATNKEVIGAIDLANGSVAVTMYIKGFHFDKSLMEEHFNENYLESDKYPKATFSGTIVSFEQFDFTKNGSFDAVINGTLELHGVKKELKTKAKFGISENKIDVQTAFDLSVADFKIKIPRMLFQNIAEVVKVSSTFNFSK
jgi:polyisoprenoid-binding protein YceI